MPWRRLPIGNRPHRHAISHLVETAIGVDVDGEEDQLICIVITGYRRFNDVLFTDRIVGFEKRGEDRLQQFYQSIYS